MSPNVQQGGLWELAKTSFRKVFEKFIRIAAEVVGDLLISLVILVGISALDYVVNWLNGGTDLVFFEHSAYPIREKTLIDIGHVANLCLFLVMSFIDCFKAYRHE